MNRTLDEYYAAFANASNKAGFNINTIEQLMLENQRNVRQVLQEANDELSSKVETEVKKNARNAAPRLSGQREGKERAETQNKNHQRRTGTVAGLLLLPLVQARGTPAG